MWSMALTLFRWSGDRLFLALAADGSTTFGGATVENGVATLVANTGNTSTTDDFSGVTVPVPAKRSCS